MGTINWESTISYPSDLSVPTDWKEIAKSGLDIIQYMDWIPDAYYDESEQFIPGSQYTTPAVLHDTLHIRNAAGQELIWGTDYTVSVVYAADMPDYGTFGEAWKIRKQSSERK